MILNRLEFISKNIVYLLLSTNKIFLYTSTYWLLISFLSYLGETPRYSFFMCFYISLLINEPHADQACDADYIQNIAADFLIALIKISESF